jgi:membrane-bound metal-dependent hydrolase YbcI (DUF457 family)
MLKTGEFRVKPLYVCTRERESKFRAGLLFFEDFLAEPVFCSFFFAASFSLGYVEIATM